MLLIPATGPWLVLVEGLCVFRTGDRVKATARAERASLGRLTTCTAVARVGDPSALRWFRCGREVTP